MTRELSGQELRERQTGDVAVALRGRVLTLRCRRGGAPQAFPDRESAARWAREHEFRADRLATNPGSYVFEQRTSADRNSFEIELNREPQVTAIISGTSPRRLARLVENGPVSLDETWVSIDSILGEAVTERARPVPAESEPLSGPTTSEDRARLSSRIADLETTLMREAGGIGNIDGRNEARAQVQRQMTALRAACNVPPPASVDELLGGPSYVEGVEPDRRSFSMKLRDNLGACLAAGRRR